MTRIAPTDIVLEVQVPPAAPYLPNLLQNPDGRWGAWGWETATDGMVTIPSLGTIRLLTGPTVGGNGECLTHWMPVKAGEYVRAELDVALDPPASGSIQYQVILDIYDVDRNGIGGAITGLLSTNGPVTLNAVAPAGAAEMRLNVLVSRADITINTDLTNLKVARAATAAELDYIDPDPIHWAPITTSSIGNTLDFTQAALNVGTLTATIRDNTLEPTAATGLRPGRKIRVTTAGGDTLWTGEISHVDTTYNLDPLTGNSVGTITVTAVDNTAALAQQAAPEGVGEVSELPYVLEGGRVPWSILGNSGSVATPSFTYTNDQATALDQVILTCLSNFAHAYVDPRGILRINANPPVSSVGFYDTTTPSYTAIDVGLATDECVNEISFTLVGDGSTITAGYWRDYDSIAEWGRHGHTYPVMAYHATKTVDERAEDILTANSQPAIKVRSLTFHVDEDTDIPTVLAIEPTSLVDVDFDGDSYTARVAAIRHTITARPDATRPIAWHVTYDFVLPTTANMPVHVPTP